MMRARQMEKCQPSLTEREVEILILRLGTTRHERGGFTMAEVQVLVDWAEQTRVDGSLLRLVLEGKIAVDVTPDGELAFGAMR